MDAEDRWIHTTPRKSATFDDYSIPEIRRAAATGIYDIRGFGAKRKPIIFFGYLQQSLVSGPVSEAVCLGARLLRTLSPITGILHHVHGRNLLS